MEQPKLTTMTTLSTRPSFIERGTLKFLIMDAPRQANLHLYIKEMRKHNVSHLVRVCEPTYRAEGELQNAGIQLHEMEYKDGTSPSAELIAKWLNLVEQALIDKSNNNNNAIAIHCVAGLGRAPVMVAIAMIEFEHMDPVDAVSFLRSKRRGAINEKQLQYLEGYKKQKRSAQSSCCVIS